MLKKISLLIVATVIIKAFGMFTYENPLLSGTQSQLSHIKTQMFAIKRAWNTERIRIKLEQKAAPRLYQTVKPVFEKVIASTQFTTTMNTAVDNQFNAIVNNNASLVKIEFNLSDFFPNISMSDFGRKLFSAMANKECYLELGKKLAQKMQALQIIITTARPTTIMPQE